MVEVGERDESNRGQYLEERETEVSTPSAEEWTTHQSSLLVVHRDVGSLDQVEVDLVQVLDDAHSGAVDAPLAREGLDGAEDSDVGVDPVASPSAQKQETRGFRKS